MKLRDQKPVPDQLCLKCGHHCNLASGVDTGVEEVPLPGAITICIRCGYVMALDDQMKFRELNAEEIEWTKTDPTVKAAKWAQRQLNKAAKDELQ